jgi:hypothetical protein
VLPDLSNPTYTRLGNPPPSQTSFSLPGCWIEWTLCLKQFLHCACPITLGTELLNDRTTRNKCPVKKKEVIPETPFTSPCVVVRSFASNDTFYSLDILPLLSLVSSPLRLCRIGRFHSLRSFFQRAHQQSIDGPCTTFPHTITLILDC